eukprot:jgi/Mesvir1/28771/Mv19736-RA.1
MTHSLTLLQLSTVFGAFSAPASSSAREKESRSWFVGVATELHKCRHAWRVWRQLGMLNPDGSTIGIETLPELPSRWARLASRRNSDGASGHGGVAGNHARLARVREQLITSTREAAHGVRSLGCLFRSAVSDDARRVAQEVKTWRQKRAKWLHKLRRLQRRRATAADASLSQQGPDAAPDEQAYPVADVVAAVSAFLDLATSSLKKLQFLGLQFGLDDPAAALVPIELHLAWRQVDEFSLLQYERSLAKIVEELDKALEAHIVGGEGAPSKDKGDVGSNADAGSTAGDDLEDEGEEEMEEKRAGQAEEAPAADVADRGVHMNVAVSPRVATAVGSPGHSPPESPRSPRSDAHGFAHAMSRMGLAEDAGSPTGVSHASDSEGQRRGSGGEGEGDQQQRAQEGTGIDKEGKGDKGVPAFDKERLRVDIKRESRTGKEGTSSGNEGAQAGKSGDREGRKGDKAGKKGDKEAQKGDKEAQKGDKEAQKGDKEGKKGDKGIKKSASGDSFPRPPSEGSLQYIESQRSLSREDLNVYFTAKEGEGHDAWWRALEAYGNGNDLVHSIMEPEHALLSSESRNLAAHGQVDDDDRASELGSITGVVGGSGRLMAALVCLCQWMRCGGWVSDERREAAERAEFEGGAAGDGEEGDGHAAGETLLAGETEMADRTVDGGGGGAPQPSASPTIMQATRGRAPSYSPLTMYERAGSLPPSQATDGAFLDEDGTVLADAHCPTCGKWLALAGVTRASAGDDASGRTPPMWCTCEWEDESRGREGGGGIRPPAAGSHQGRSSGGPTGRRGPQRGMYLGFTSQRWLLVGMMRQARGGARGGISRWISRGARGRGKAGEASGQDMRRIHGMPTIWELAQGRKRAGRGSRAIVGRIVTVDVRRALALAVCASSKLRRECLYASALLIEEGAGKHSFGNSAERKMARETDEERWTYHMHLLKNSLLSSLLLDVTAKRPSMFVADLVGMTVAGLAMGVAIMFTYYATRVSKEQFAWRVVFILIVSYIIKDRIKEWGKRYLIPWATWCGIRFPDRISRITNRNGKLLGMTAEELHVMKRREIPAAVRKARDAVQNRPALAAAAQGQRGAGREADGSFSQRARLPPLPVVGQEGRPETILVYAKDVHLRREVLLREGGDVSPLVAGLYDIVRFNLTRIRHRMEAPLETHRLIQESDLSLHKVRYPRVYHVNTIVRIVMERTPAAAPGGGESSHGRAEAERAENDKLWKSLYPVGSWRHWLESLRATVRGWSWPRLAAVMLPFGLVRPWNRNMEETVCLHRVRAILDQRGIKRVERVDTDEDVWEVVHAPQSRS